MSSVLQPNAEGIIKMAIHTGGHTRDIRMGEYGTVSAPRTVLTHGEAEGSRIPTEVARELRGTFQEIYPALANSKPFVSTRMCW